MASRMRTNIAIDDAQVEVSMPSTPGDGTAQDLSFFEDEPPNADNRKNERDEEEHCYSSTSSNSDWSDHETVQDDQQKTLATIDNKNNRSENPAGSPAGTNSFVWIHRTLLTYWRNHRVTCLWLLLYGASNMAAFYYKASVYAFDPEKETARDVFGSCLMVARGSALCLNLNACLILLPLCRHLWTFVQTMPALRCYSCSADKTKRLHLTSFLPLDQWAVIHRVIGIIFLYWTLVHCLAHCCDFYRFAHYPYEEDLYLLMPHEETIPADPAGRWKLLLRQPAAITGIIMTFCILVAYPCAMLHRRMGYNVFWYSHHLLLVMLVTLLFHGMGELVEPMKSIYWVGIPLCLYMFPRIWREVAGMCCSRAKFQVLELSVKPGNVVVLRLTKPPSWSPRLRAGMYANLNIPHLSLLQWHPFTLSSAPSDDYLEFHIRPVGDWTMEFFHLANNFSSSAAKGSPPTLKEIQQASALQVEDEEEQVDEQPHNKAATSSRTFSWNLPSDSRSSRWLWDGGSSMMNWNINAVKGSADTSPVATRSGAPTENLTNDSSPRSSRWLWDSGPSVMSMDTHDKTNGQLAPFTYSGTSGTSSSSSTGNQQRDMTPHELPAQLRELVVKVDGPLGTACQGYSQHRMVVLVGAGIGVTPMVSVLKELLANPGKMQRTYMIWSFRERRAMDWFASLIEDVLLQQRGRRRHHDANKGTPMLQLRFYVTKKDEEEQHNNYESHGKTMTVVRGRRPCWHQELSRVQGHIRAQDYNRCGVFVCGPDSMTRTIKDVCFEISRQDPNFHFDCRQEMFSM